MADSWWDKDPEPLTPERLQEILVELQNEERERTVEIISHQEWMRRYGNL